MKELYLHLVYLHDIDDAVNNNPIIVLFNHEGIAINNRNNGTNAQYR